METFKKVFRELNAGRKLSIRISLFFFIVAVLVNDTAAHHTVSYEYEDIIKVERLRVEDGISQNTINVVYQDIKGFLWFGTENGLNRYDGYSFRQYRSKTSKFLLDEWITAISGDEEGNLWVGTQRMGLKKLNCKTKEFETYKHVPGEPNSLCSNEITAISGPHRDPEGNAYLWVGTTSGLSRMTQENKNSEIKFENYYAFDSTHPTGLISNHIRRLYETEFQGKQCLWIGTSGGLSRFIPENTGQQWTHFIREPNSKPNHTRNILYRTLTNNLITDICETGPKTSRTARTLWVSSIDGLNRFTWDPDGNPQIKHCRNDPPNTNTPIHDAITALEVDNTGKSEILWIGTARHGLSKMDIKTGRFVHYRREQWDGHSLGDNRVSSLHLDRSGILWMGGRFDGVSKIVYGPGKIKFKYYRHTPNQPDSIWYKNVRAITESAVDSVLWIGTLSGGLNRLDRDTGRVKHYRHDPSDHRTIGSNSVFCVYEDRAGVLWVGTERGLDHLQEDGTFSHFGHVKEPGKKGYMGSGVRTIMEDRDGNLWFGATGGGLYKFDPQRKQVINYKYQHSNPNSLSGNSIYTMLLSTEGEREIIWIGTYGRGLNKFDIQSETFQRYFREPGNPNSISSDSVLCLRRCPVKPERFLYIGTYGGSLCKLDIKTGLFTNFMEKDGLLDHVIYGCLGDNTGNLWLSTNSGLINVNVETETFRHYDASDGLLGNEFNGGAYFKSRTGELFFGGSHGLNSFHPEAIEENRNKPPINVSVNVNFQEIAAVDSTTKQEEPIKLSYTAKIISFQFTALDFTCTAKNQYRYKLEGIDKEWVYSATRRTVNYTHLDPGDYEIRVKASNNDGIWNEEGVSVRFVIMAPLTGLFWFRALVGLGLFTFVLFLARTFLMARKKRELQQQVDKRTEELRKATDEARESAEKAEHANQAKSQFLANMSHEIRTPMAGVVGLIELVQESQLSDEQARHVKMIKQSANQLLGVLNDILDFSKIEAGQLVLESMDLDLHALVNEISDIFHYRAAEKGILFSMGLHGTVPENVMGDSKRLKQILLNLLGNAVKFTERGTISLTVYLEEEIEKKETVSVHFVVSDTGIGIPEHRLSHLFESFTQADASTTRRFGGTGLGLAISKQLVELMTGEIWAKSREGEGTDFHFVIPFALPPAPPAPPAAPLTVTVSKEERRDRINDASQAKPPEENNFKLEPGIDLIAYLEQLKDRVRLLLVEDNPINQKVAMSMVKRTGIPMDIAPDGLMALEALRNIKYDLILMDVQMPNMDGLEATKKIRQELGLTQLPIIALTANALKEDMERCYEAGMNDFIMKPFKPHDLYNAFLKWLPRTKITDIE